jgi:hypothetical protein
MSLDLQAAAQDFAERANRYAPIYTAPDLPECVKLLHRNPAIAPAIRKAIELELARLPGGGVGLDKPLFEAETRPLWATGA